MAHRAGVYSGFRSIKRLEVTLLPLDGMLVHRRSLPVGNSMLSQENGYQFLEGKKSRRKTQSFDSCSRKSIDDH